MKPFALFVLAFGVLVFSFNALSIAAETDSLVAAAWQAWQLPDNALVEKYFRAALVQDPVNTRARLGLALLHSMNQDHAKSWEALRPLFISDSTPYANLIAFWSTLHFRMRDQLKESGLLVLLQRLSSRTDASGTVAPLAQEVLAEYYRQRADLPTSDTWYERMNTITSWMLIGPFDNVSACGYERAYPPESEYNPASTYDGKSGVPASWFPIAAPHANRWIDLLKHFPVEQAVFYANTFVFSPAKRPVHIRVGTSGFLKTYLNDQLIIADSSETNNNLDTFVAETELQQGWNRILIKCGYSEISRCNFMLRITDLMGQPVDGISISIEPHDYQRRSSAPIRVLGNPFETFFQERIRTHPDRPEDFALLSKVYLWNGKLEPAEITLRSALKKWPRCALFHQLLMECYRRGPKSSEVGEIVTTLSSLDPSFPDVLSYRFYEAIRNEDFALADELLAAYKVRRPEKEDAYILEMLLRTKQGQIGDLLTLTARAAELYPSNWEFAELEALIAYEIDRNVSKCVEILSAFLTRSYTTTALLTLASYHLKATNVSAWESVLQSALLVEPAATGYYQQMAEVYLLTRELDKAQNAMQMAIKLCPSSSLYRRKLGDVYRAAGKSTEAKAAYRLALTYRPTDEDAREALRELEGRKPLFMQVVGFDIDSLVRVAPVQAACPNDNGVILLYDTRRAVFERGATVATNEILVRVFNKKGIDDWKEYRIPYNPNNQRLIVEKAFVRKDNGTEVKADVNDAHVVFKALSANDFVYVKWRVTNYYEGRLAQHFWDTHFFNGIYPVRIGRYALLVPADIRFTSQTQEFANAPSKQLTEDGIIYEWSVMNEPGIRLEQGMPGLEDIGKVLYITTIPSWSFVVDWYSDLARTKVRSSFEIEDQVKLLMEGRPGISQDEKLRIVYEFITEHIRYSSVSFRQSAYVPQRARDVLVNRIGDCKDLSTLCIAMLQELGIPSHYVLVNTLDQGLNTNVPPGIVFNHCIVGTQTNTGVKYLDLTASDYPLGTVPWAVNGAFALPITSNSQSPTYLDNSHFAPDKILRTTSATIDEDHRLTLDVRSQRTGQPNASMRNQYRTKNRAEQVNRLAEIISQRFSNVSVSSFSLDSLSNLEPVTVDHQRYSIPQYITEAGAFFLLRLPWTDAFEPDERLSYETRKYPLYIGTGKDTLQETMDLVLPVGYSLQGVPRSKRYECAVATYSVSYQLSNRKLRAQRTYVSTKSVVRPEEYLAYKTFYSNCMKEDSQQLLLKKK